MGAEVRILVMRHASFYAPLIGTIAGGFLEAEGLEGSYQVKPLGRNPFEMLENGEVDLMQSAVSSSWARIERGARTLPRHFARINRRDGFWLLGREDAALDWTALEGRVVLADHGPQPLAMLRYAAWQRGADPAKIIWKDVGEPADIEEAWRAGEGDFAHFQGPRPQQIVSDGGGVVVASVGEAIGPVAFSSIAAQPAYLATHEAKAFMRAYTRCLDWLLTSTSDAVARRLSRFFPAFEVDVLARSISDYQSLGCWDKSPAIPRPEYEQALDVFEWNGLISARYDYDVVVSDPWADPSFATWGLKPE